MRSRESIHRDEDELGNAARVLADGGVVAVPTDTLYGLAADAFNQKAVERVFRLKGRPERVPLPLLLASPQDVLECAIHVPEQVWQLAERFWPGPLTLVLRKADRIPAVVSAGGDTVALRVPRHDLTTRIIRTLGHPITGTSANRSGALPATTADEVRRIFGDELDLVVGSASSADGVASTVLDLSQDTPRIVRLGAVTPDEIEAAIGLAVTTA